jgi:hypothetical protein
LYDYDERGKNKMTKRISISIPDYLYDSYLSEFVGKNLSVHIQKLIVMGSDAMIENQDTTKSKLIKLTNENQILYDEVRKLKLQIDNFKGKMNRKLQEYDGIETMEQYNDFKDKETKAKAFIRSLQLGGALNPK